MSKAKSGSQPPTDPTKSTAQAEADAAAGMDDYIDAAFGSPNKMETAQVNVPQQVPQQNQGAPPQTAQPIPPDPESGRTDPYGEHGPVMDQYGNILPPADAGGMHGQGAPLNVDNAVNKIPQPQPHAQAPVPAIPSPGKEMGGVPPIPLDGGLPTADDYFGKPVSPTAPAQPVAQPQAQQSAQPPQQPYTPEGNYLGTYKDKAAAEAGLQNTQTHVQRMAQENAAFRDKYGALEGQIQTLTSMIQNRQGQPQQQQVQPQPQDWDKYEEKLRDITDKQSEWVATAQLFNDLQLARETQAKVEAQQKDIALNQWRAELKSQNPGITPNQVDEVISEYNKLLNSPQPVNPLELIRQAKFGNGNGGVPANTQAYQPVQGQPPIQQFTQPGQPPYQPVQYQQTQPYQQQPIPQIDQVNYQRQIEAMKNVKRGLPPVAPMAPPPVNLNAPQGVQKMKDAWNGVVQGNMQVDDGLDQYTENMFNNHYQAHNRGVQPIGNQGPIRRANF